MAFPHKEGTGFNIQLRSLPVDGKLVVLPANANEEAEHAPAAQPLKEARAARR